LCAIAVVLAASLLEGGVRLAGFKPRTPVVNRFFVEGADTTWSVPDPQLGWVNKPGVANALEEGHAPMTFWSFSRRAVRESETPPEDAVPVMIIGGSNAQAYGVRDQDSFVYRLQQRFPKLWFEDFGTGGYSTVQSLMLAERALEKFYVTRKPKIILLAFDDSHMARNVADQSWIFSISDTKGQYAVPPHYRLRDGKLVFHPYETIGFWPLERRSAAISLLHDVWLKRVAYNSMSESVDVTRRVIDMLAAFAARHDAYFGVVVLEDRSATTPALFAGQSYPHHDCSGPEREDPKAYILGGGNGHPNAQLHAHYAECLGAWLEDVVLPAAIGSGK
jgi:hypothetical protein